MSLQPILIIFTLFVSLTIVMTVILCCSGGKKNPVQSKPEQAKPLEQSPAVSTVTPPTEPETQAQLQTQDQPQAQLEQNQTSVSAGGSTASLQLVTVKTTENQKSTSKIYDTGKPIPENQTEIHHSLQLMSVRNQDVNPDSKQSEYKDERQQQSVSVAEPSTINTEISLNRVYPPSSQTQSMSSVSATNMSYSVQESSAPVKRVPAPKESSKSTSIPGSISKETKTKATDIPTV